MHHPVVIYSLKTDEYWLLEDLADKLIHAAHLFMFYSQQVSLYFRGGWSGDFTRAAQIYS
jgi:hypothetical protein